MIFLSLTFSLLIKTKSYNIEKTHIPNLILVQSNIAIQQGIMRIKEMAQNWKIEREEKNKTINNKII